MPSTTFTAKITEVLTEILGRAPTADEIIAGETDTLVLSRVKDALDTAHNELTIEPGDDIPAAIANLVADGGGILHLTVGTYDVATDIVIASNIHFGGVSSGGTIIDFGGGAYQVKVIGTDIYTTGTVTVNTGDITIIGSGTTWDVAMEGQSIFLQGTFYVIATVSDPTTIVITTPYQGSNLSGASYGIATPNESVTISGLTVQNSSVDLINLQYAYNLAANDVTVVNSSATGILIDSCNFMNTNIIFVDLCDKGIVATNCAGFTFANTNVTDCDSGAIELTDFSNSVVIDSSVDTCGVFGFKLTNVNNVGIQQISNANIDGTGWDIHGGGFALAVTESDAFNCTGDGMKLSDSVQGFSTYGVTFQDNGGYGLNIDSGCTDNSVGLSLFAGNSSGPVSDSGTGTLIRSNIGVADN